jgi:hypothetical protein
MSRLPPSSPTSLPSLFVAFLAHAGVVVAGLVGMSAEPMESTSTPMIYVPIDLVTIDEMTNLTAVAQAPQTDESREAQEEENNAAPAPSMPPPEEDAVSFEELKPKVEPKKTEANPAPAKPAKSFNSDLDDILSSVTKDAPKQRNNSANTAPAAANEAPRLSAGDKRRMTASVEDVIRSQLISNGCWADHSDMADAKRLKATFRVSFGRNGKFAQAYQMVSPARPPMNDPPLQAFIVHAQRALNMCNNIGWVVPEEYFTRLQSPYLDIEFLPKIGAMP